MSLQILACEDVLVGACRGTSVATPLKMQRRAKEAQ